MKMVGALLLDRGLSFQAGAGGALEPDLDAAARVNQLQLDGLLTQHCQ